jgi:hypothetical protein
MRLSSGQHLAYCTNIHRGETWPEVYANLKTHVMAVRDQVGQGRPYAIGLRLGVTAAAELSDRSTRLEFQRWLEAENAYVFTINGFPYGQFHGTRVKERVYQPDWCTAERVDYTCRLFDLLAELLPPGVEGSVSTVPGSFKAFIREDAQVRQMAVNLLRCADYLAGLCSKTGKVLHLGVEPEPLCYLETTPETVAFFERIAELRPGDDSWRAFLGVNYDTCHLAVEFEDPAWGLEALRREGIRISKLHLSSALRVENPMAASSLLRGFCEETYLHQVVARESDGTLRRFPDLPEALESLNAAPVVSTSAVRPGSTASLPKEWRIHFHVPLQGLEGEGLTSEGARIGTTIDSLRAVLDWISRNPAVCGHLEMETYTWEVMPSALRRVEVVDQIAAEYEWTLRELRSRGVTA